ncbi:MAG: SDR family oxidoreductase [Chloroflexaceae bacterium]|nr:SDR family oxidoreductase [Chloroflexaceae bacterium]
MHKWTATNIPDQTGKLALITGANSGLGYETALALAGKGAHVVMTSRSMQKGEAARTLILKQVPGATVDVLTLDLASLASVRAFAETFSSRYQRLDMLFNNAGVMAPPRQETADGFEMQFGTNHLGHFALTGLLLDMLLKTPASRVVTTSSSAQFAGTIKFDDLQGVKSYSRYGAYGQSKLANVLFAFELQRRLAAAGASIISVAVHPGLVRTNLQTTTVASTGSGTEGLMYRIVMPLLSMTPEEGARPQLYAATMPDVKGGEHIAVQFMHIRGYPARVRAAGPAYNLTIARQLWEVSEELTGVRYTALAQPQTV